MAADLGAAWCAVLKCNPGIPERMSTLWLGFSGRVYISHSPAGFSSQRPYFLGRVSRFEVQRA